MTLLSGRSILASVALCEAAMGEAKATNRSAAGLFLDFANALPALARRWLRLVLRRARVPEPFVQAVLCLYADMRSLFVFGDEVVTCVELRCGVKQGCPVSGTRSALCVDGMLRLLSSVPPRCRCMFAYADDLAIVTRGLRHRPPPARRLLAHVCIGVALRSGKAS